MKAKTQVTHHIGLSMPDIKAATKLFAEALGFDQIGEKLNCQAAFVSDGTIMVTLWRVEDPERANSFYRHANISWHHLALHVASADDLEKLYTELATREDVAIEFKPEPLTGSTYRHMMCAIPGNSRFELIRG